MRQPRVRFSPRWLRDASFPQNTPTGDCRGPWGHTGAAKEAVNEDQEG